MSDAIKGVDWNLLHEQKLVLLGIRGSHREGSREADALSGIIHLVDALQDEAVERGVWAFPDEDSEEAT